MANAPTPFINATATEINKLTNTKWTPYLVPALLAYTLLCSSLRYRRRDSMQKKFKFQDRQALSRMTNEEAQAILAYLSELEFPRILLTSIQFALFKTYGIPTISSLLAATKEFSSTENASKRYVDTAVIISEFTGHHPKNERVIKAIARMSYIHSQYQKSGKISQDDLLYTLSVFVTEPITWVKQYEWRELTDMEICAIGTVWKSIGDAMGIEYTGRLARTEWKDGIEFYEDIKQWAHEYVMKNMVPMKANKQTADELVPLLLYYVPGPFKSYATKCVGVMMGERLRDSMMFPTPPSSAFVLVHSVLMIRKLLLRYLALPRPDFLRERNLVDRPDPKTGRYHIKNYMVHPYYNKPGFRNRWGPEAWLVWLYGADIPGSKGEKYIPEGYVFEEVGPRRMKGKGQKEMQEEEEKLKERPAGCPFAFAR